MSSNSPEEILQNVRDALEAVLKLYEDQNRTIPANLRQDPGGNTIWLESLVSEL